MRGRLARKLIIVAVLALMAFVAVGSLVRTGPGTAGTVAGPDVGGNIAFVRAGSIWLYSGGESTQITRGPQDPQDKVDSSPAFSPDGTQLVYVRYDEGFSIHTNTVEGVFSVFKRGMKGIYQHCDEKHLHRYLAEFDFRYNNRIALGVNDASRADAAIRGVVGSA